MFLLIKNRKLLNQKKKLSKNHNLKREGGKNMPRNRVGTLTVDDLMKELEKAKSEKIIVQNDIFRLSKEKDFLQKEVNELSNKKENISSFIKQKEAEWKKKADDREKVLEDKIKEAEST